MRAPLPLLLALALPAGARAGCLQETLDRYCSQQHTGMIARVIRGRWDCYSGPSRHLATQCVSDSGELETCYAHEPLPYFRSDVHHQMIFSLMRTTRCSSVARAALVAPPPPLSPPPPMIPIVPPTVTLTTTGPSDPDGLRIAVSSQRFRVMSSLDADSNTLESRHRVAWLYRWNATWAAGPAGAAGELDLGAVDASAGAASNLVVARDVLVPGRLYTFTLAVTTAQLAETVLVSTRARVNRSPRDGSIAVSPASGVEMTTQFALEAPGWVDEDGPITYAFFYARHPGAPPADDVPLRAFEPRASASAYLPAGDFHLVVRVSDRYGGETRHVAAAATHVAAEALTGAVVDTVLSAAKAAPKAVQQQLCSALAQKLNSAAPLPPADGAHGPLPRELEAEELAAGMAARASIIDIIGAAPTSDADLSASALSQEASTVTAVLSRPDQLDSDSQVKAAQLVKRLASGGAKTGLSDGDSTGALLVDSLSSLLSTNSSADDAAAHDSVNGAVHDAAAEIGRGLLHGLLPGEAPVGILSPKLNVTAAREMPHRLQNASLAGPGGRGGVRLPSGQPLFGADAAAAQEGVDVKMVSFGRNVHADPAAKARAALALAQAELARAPPHRRRLAEAAVGAASEELRHTLGTPVLQVKMAAASDGAEIAVRGLVEPIIIELLLDADSASQHSADPVARARNRACVDGHFESYGARRAAAGGWLWFNGTAVDDEHAWAYYRQQALASGGADVAARYGDYERSLDRAPDDYPRGADGAALERARALNEIMSQRALVLELAHACPEPAPAACRYWDEPSGNWSSAGCEALPRLPEFSYGLHLLDGGAGDEDPRARTVRCACTHLTDFAGLSIPMNREELLDQIRAVHVNTFSLKDYTHAMSHINYGENPEIYDLVISLFAANALFLIVACAFDQHALRARRRMNQEAVRLALSTRGSARERHQLKKVESSLRDSRTSQRKSSTSAPGQSVGRQLSQIGGFGAAAREGPNKLGRHWTGMHAKIGDDVKEKVTERLADEHTLFAVFLSGRAYSRAQLVQIFFNVIAVELVTECMLFSADPPAAEAGAELGSEPGAEPGADAADAAGGHELVTYIINSLITSAVCLPAMIAFKNLWFLYEFYPFNRCLSQPTRAQLEAAAVRVQCAYRGRVARRERKLRERHAGLLESAAAPRPAGGGGYGRGQSAAKKPPKPDAPAGGLMLPPASAPRAAAQRAHGAFGRRLLGGAPVGAAPPAPAYARLRDDKPAEAPAAEALSAEDAALAKKKAARAQHKRELAQRRAARRERNRVAALKSARVRWCRVPLYVFEAAAWGLMWLAVAFCASVIITYGSVLGKEASRSMLMSWGIALGQTFFVHEPLMLTISAAAPVVIKGIAALPSFGSALAQFDGLDETLDSIMGWIDYFSQV